MDDQNNMPMGGGDEQQPQAPGTDMPAGNDQPGMGGETPSEGGEDKSGEEGTADSQM